jgi:hypothetical protein
MKLDNETREVMKHLIEERIFLPHSKSIDISKVVDMEDRKVDLWLLELIVRTATKFLLHASGSSIKKVKIGDLIGLPEYCEERGIEFCSIQMNKEYSFLLNFVDNIVEDESFQSPEQ